jgi:hypothetical protein
VALHRHWALGESLQKGTRIGVAMLPTLVFTLVIAGILRDTYAVPPPIFGGLVIYTLANTLIPGYVLRLPATEIDLWHGDWQPPAPAAPVAEPVPPRV